MKPRLAGTVNRLNVEHRTSNIDDATLYLILKQSNRSLQRALRQAQGLSTSKAAESNFEGKLRSCSASSPQASIPYAYRPETQALAPSVAQFF
jgi:hypothetical protein